MGLRADFMNSFFKENEVSPLAAAVAEEIRKYDMIRPGERVVVGLSGGPDSVCLLAVLSELRVQLGIESLHAVHVNHGLRGAESDRDERYAEQLAMSMGASFDAARYDVRKLAAEQKLSEEEMGRKLRYETFEQFRQIYGAHRIAVAHNRNDQAETVMMRILRGTGLRGLSGIPRIRGDGILIYHEHCGKPWDPAYMAHHKWKLEQYEAVGIVPWDNLIITYDLPGGGIDMALVDAEIRSKLLV